MQVPGSTLAGVTDRQTRLTTWARRCGLALLVLVVAAGATGLLGVRTATVTDEADGWRLDLEHATVARAGLDVPFEVRVHRVGGFDETLTLAVSGDYFDIYETQGFTPEPLEATRDVDTLYLTFAAPQGEVFVLDYDAYIQPSSQWGESGTLSVLQDGGAPVVTVDFTTRLLP